MGKPSIRTPEIVDAVCDAVSQGRTLISICNEVCISRDAWDDWVNADDDLKRRFARARERGHDMIAHRARATARGLSDIEGGDSSGDVQRDKLIIETDLKLLAKWDRRYADKLGIGQAEGLEPVAVRHIERRIVDNAPD